LALIAIGAALALGAGHVAGRLHALQPLAPTAAELSAAGHLVVLFGNSRFEAGILPEPLAAALGPEVRARAFTGGGWDAVHYLMLAILSRDLLRPERDAVVIEVSPMSLNDFDSANRLGTVRPEAARAVAALPGAPVELRLDVLTGALAGLYRYRVSLQSIALAPQLDRLAATVGGELERFGLLGAPPEAPPFTLVTAPGRNFVIQEIKGDRSRFDSANRRLQQAQLATLQVGGFKLAALDRAVAMLRERRLPVFLVETPTSPWLSQKLDAAPAGPRYHTALRALAERRGALLLDAWPAPLTDDERFWDGMHMVAGASRDFTAALALRLRARLGW
jgi:hypothetical protein